MEDFLRYLITPLLSLPDQLTISTSASTVTLVVDPADTGRIIGRHGQTINYLRTLLKTYCALHSLTQVYLYLNAPPKEQVTSS